jgi:iron complex transport system substrate-binding protein
VIGSNGKVTVSKRPARIVSLSPTATETLFAIGAGSQVVAADDPSDFPKSAPKTSLSGFTPNVEAIAAYRPDLVVIAYDPKGLSGALDRLGITVLHQDGAKSFKGAYQQIRQLGRSPVESTAATPRSHQRMRREARSARSSPTRKRGGRALPVYHELDPTLFSATPDVHRPSVHGARPEHRGRRRLGRVRLPQLSAEYVVSVEPDVIVLADTCCGTEGARRSPRVRAGIA